MLVSLSDEVKEQLTDAAQQTNKAYNSVRKGRDGEPNEGGARSAYQDNVKASSVGQYLSSEIVIMQPILRFLQLLCENHNAEMQVLLIDQLFSDIFHSSSHLS